MIKHILFIVLSIGFLGCSGEQMAHSITKTQIAMSGNKPTASFQFANLETMRDYVFQTDDFSFSLPSSKKEDYIVMGGWIGESMRDGKTIVIGLKNTITYHISISTYIDKYTSKEKELENGTKKYSNIKVQPNGKVVNINVHSEYHGKENYQCIVAQSYNEKLGKYSKGYRCYKFNPERTMYKSVMIKLTYNQSSSKQYTYQDLQKRAKRTIDSLYIKDGW